MRKITAADPQTGTLIFQDAEGADYLEVLDCADYENEVEGAKALEQEEERLFLLAVTKI